MYVYILMLACVSTSILPSAHHKFKPFFDKHEDSISVIYDLASTPYARIQAKRTKKKDSAEHTYEAEYMLNAYPNWVKLSATEALDYFSKLEAKYKTYSDALYAQKVKKEEKVKMEIERHETMITTKYKQKKDGITRFAERMLMYSGKEFFGSFVKGAKNNLNSQELFEELAEIYRRENPPKS